MAESHPWLVRSHNLVQSTHLGAKELPKVVAGGAGLRWRRVAEIGQDALMAGLGQGRALWIFNGSTPKFLEALQWTRGRD